MNGNPHSKDFHNYLIEKGTREEIIEWLQWNDSNGCYSDEMSIAEGMPVLSREDAINLLIEQKDG